LLAASHQFVEGDVSVNRAARAGAERACHSRS
jgi:hypothetical protein